MASCTKFMLILELLFIVFYSIFTLIEIVSTFAIFGLQSDNQYKYFTQMINNRIIPGRITLNISLTKSQCETDSISNLKTVANHFAELGIIKSAKLIDVTQTAQIPSPNFPHLFLNTTRTGYKYYKFPLKEKGDDEITLLTNYLFEKWRGYNFCGVEAWVENPKSIAFVAKEDSCDNFFKLNNSVDCGIFHNTYRMCLNSELVELNKTLLFSQVDNLTKEEASKYLCPINYVTFDLTPANSTKGKTKDSYNMKVLKGNKPVNGELADYENQFFFTILDHVDYGSYTLISDPYTNIDLGTTDQKTMTIKLTNSFDSFSEIGDVYSYMDFYRDNFAQNLFNQTTEKYYFNVQYLPDPTGTLFYTPTDENNDYEAMYLMFSYKAFSGDCFNNFVNQNGNNYFFFVLQQTQTSYLNESVSTLIAWLFVKLFISIFWHWKIRFTIIYRQLRNYLGEADKDSEFATKLTARVVGLIMFVIILWGTWFQKSKLETSISICQALIDNNCFTDDLVVKSLNAYINYIKDINVRNAQVTFYILSSAGMEFLLFIYYIIEYFSTKKPPPEDKLKRQ